MQPMKSGGTGIAKRRAWRPPALTVLAIGRETKVVASQRSDVARFQPDGAAAAGRFLRWFERAN
jgi:hypothetical protein